MSSLFQLPGAMLLNEGLQNLPSIGTSSTAFSSSTGQTSSSDCPVDPNMDPISAAAYKAGCAVRNAIGRKAGQAVSSVAARSIDYARIGTGLLGLLLIAAAVLSHPTVVNVATKSAEAAAL